ncbi:MAG: class I SAM-dependent methyltransferase [Deltaproteobacteria bacterium]
METVNCNLCGSSEYRTLYGKPDVRYHPDEVFTVVECLRCGLGFVNPRPDSSEIENYYPPSFYQRYERDTDFHTARYARQARYLERLRTKQPRLLDVGCANGGFPRFMKEKGWLVEGLEISPHIRVPSDFPVHRVPFHEADIPHGAYDAVTMWAVLEHVHDPMAYIARTSVVLKTKGLFVFVVPNFDSLASRLLLGEDVPRHLYFFTERTITRYMDMNGLRLLSARYGYDTQFMHPNNLLMYALHRLTKKGPFEASELKTTREQFLRTHGLEPGIGSTMRYILSHPLATADSALALVAGPVEKLIKRYGMVTYVAEKT